MKSHGFRKLSQVGKGAFMIGSTGWCYHHKTLEFDRKNKVVLFMLFRVGSLERKILLK